MRETYLKSVAGSLFILGGVLLYTLLKFLFGSYRREEKDFVLGTTPWYAGWLRGITLIIFLVPGFIIGLVLIVTIVVSGALLGEPQGAKQHRQQTIF